MKSKIYENEKIVIYAKSNPDCGDEGDLAYEIFMAAITGYVNFAGYLKNPIPFWENVKKEIEKKLNEVDKEIKNL